MPTLTGSAKALPFQDAHVHIETTHVGSQTVGTKIQCGSFRMIKWRDIIARCIDGRHIFGTEELIALNFAAPYILPALASGTVAGKKEHFIFFSPGNGAYRWLRIGVSGQINVVG
jgi:hypothetical protein